MQSETIRILPNKRQKFVLVRAERDGEESLMLWGNPQVEWHKDIVDEISAAGYEISEILGGGRLLPKPEEGVVYVWGKSDRFGIAPIDLVKEVLKDTVIEREPE